MQTHGTTLWPPAELNTGLNARLVDAVRCMTHLQVVMLGAGLDSRPWRLLLPPGVAWFEVDMPACIAIKQSRLHQIGAGMSHTDEPDTKSFPLKAATWSAVGADATDPCLIELLGAVGFDPSVPTVFVCEGLWYYLSPDKLDEMLQHSQANYVLYANVNVAEHWHIACMTLFNGLNLQLLARSSPVGSTILADAMDDKFMQHNRKQARELYAAKMKFAPPVIDSMKSTYPWDCTDRLAKAGWTLEAATDARGWAKACGRTPAADLIYTVQTLPTSLQSDSMPASPPTKNGHLFTVRAARY
ncbi:hypothetical protein MMC07_000430 [Pseudocyphellaria aurata]|nr:hypothetical protein [Pseudocyphellaria aurata]